MQAITLEDGELQFRDDYDIPVPLKDEVLVRVLKAGICETDLQLAQGYMEFRGVLGHEFVGVAQSGPLSGCRVVGEINCNCRQCPTCQAGLGNHCSHRTVIGIDRHDGAFAEYVSVPQHCLHAIPDSVSDEEAVFVEPLAAAFQIGQQVPVARSDRTVVLGDGRLAFLCAQALATVCDQITVVGKHEPKLARFSQLGFNTVRLEQCDPQPAFDVVVDCTGSATGLPLALALARPRGTVVMKTTIAAGHEVSLALVVINELNLVGSRCGPFDQAIRAIEERTISVADLITHRYELQDGVQAMSTATTPGAFKVVFDISQREA